MVRTPLVSTNLLAMPQCIHSLPAGALETYHCSPWASSQPIFLPSSLTSETSASASTLQPHLIPCTTLAKEVRDVISYSKMVQNVSCTNTTTDMSKDLQWVCFRVFWATAQDMSRILKYCRVAVENIHEELAMQNKAGRGWITQNIGPC